MTNGKKSDKKWFGGNPAFERNYKEMNPNENITPERDMLIPVVKSPASKRDKTTCYTQANIFLMWVLTEAAGCLTQLPLTFFAIK